MTYDVEYISPRFWTGTLNHKKLADLLNARAGQGWKFEREITSTRRKLVIFKRETHFLVFSKPTTA
jgi:hypothetical protein